MNQNYKTIKDVNIKDKIVLVRADYNVPIKNGKITSDLRIRASLPTINYLLEHGVKRIYLISHLGRPEGKENLTYSLSPVADALRTLLPDQQIGLYSLPQATETPMDTASDTSDKDNPLHIPDSIKIALLENLRFDPGEEANDPVFIKRIINATHPDFYVQDGFAVIHRAHASTDAIKNFLPVYAGLLLDHEITALKKATDHPEHPVLLIIGGSKVEDKEPLITKFLPLADHIAVGGKIAADGYTASDPKIYVATDFDTDATGAKLDIGPLSTGEIANLITDAKTIIWNGCLGKTEDPAYATASTIVAELLGEKQDATTIVCGGDTTGFVENLMKDHKSLHYTLVSTGGGAALEFLLGKKLPGLESIGFVA